MTTILLRKKPSTASFLHIPQHGSDAKDAFSTKNKANQLERFDLYADYTGTSLVLVSSRDGILSTLFEPKQLRMFKFLYVFA
jgi:hypothetical protein